MKLWLDREAPQFGTCTFTPTGEYGLVLRIKHGDRVIGENDGAVGITERTNSNEGVCEGWEDVAFGGSLGDLWKCESALSSGLLNLPHGGTDVDCGSEWVNVSTRGTLSQVYATRSTIKYGSVNKRKW